MPPEHSLQKRPRQLRALSRLVLEGGSAAPTTETRKWGGKNHLFRTRSQETEGCCNVNLYAFIRKLRSCDSWLYLSLILSIDLKTCHLFFLFWTTKMYPFRGHREVAGAYPSCI